MPSSSPVPFQVQGDQLVHLAQLQGQRGLDIEVGERAAGMGGTQWVGLRQPVCWRWAPQCPAAAGSVHGGFASVGVAAAAVAATAARRATHIPTTRLDQQVTCGQGLGEQGLPARAGVGAGCVGAHVLGWVGEWDVQSKPVHSGAFSRIHWVQRSLCRLVQLARWYRQLPPRARGPGVLSPWAFQERILDDPQPLLATAAFRAIRASPAARTSGVAFRRHSGRAPHQHNLQPLRRYCQELRLWEGSAQTAPGVRLSCCGIMQAAANAPRPPRHSRSCSWPSDRPVEGTAAAC